jgi:hypothetical protein
MKRKVMVYKYVKTPGENYNKRVEDREGIFHQWGCDYEDFGNDTGNFSTAIVEFPDGTVKNVPVKDIKFLKEIKCEKASYVKKNADDEKNCQKCACKYYDSLMTQNCSYEVNGVPGAGYCPFFIEVR